MLTALKENYEHNPVREDTYNDVAPKQLGKDNGRVSRGCRSMKSDYESKDFISAIEDDEELRKMIEEDEKKDAIIEMARNFKPHTDLSDDYRLPGAHKDGGFPMNDAAVLERYRSAFKDIASQIGRSIFTGRFNLGSVSFPIKCMSP